MMELIQWGFNLAFVVGFILLWTWQKKIVAEKVSNDFTEALQQRDLRLMQLESEVQKVRDTFQDRIKEIESIIEQANRVLKSARSVGGAFPLTQEESELKEAMYFNLEKDSIPSVAHLENTKIRLQKESNLDLKTLLKGQLS